MSARTHVRLTTLLALFAWPLLTFAGQQQFGASARASSSATSQSSTSSRYTTETGQMTRLADAGTTAAALKLQLAIAADRQEAVPGDTLEFVIGVQNEGDQTVTGLFLENTFDPQMERITESTGGSPLGQNKILWADGTLGPKEQKLLRFRAELNPALQTGNIVRNTATVRLGQNGDTFATAHTDVGILGSTPMTGPSDFAGQLEDTARFLLPMGSDGASGSWGIMLVTALMGLGAGARIAWRRSS